MKIVVTGASGGIGRAVCLKYLALGHTVVGIDRLASDVEDEKYTHFIADVKDPLALPEIEGVGVLVNNAGEQNGDDDIGNNLVGAINVTEKYIGSPELRSVLFNASASAVTGREFPLYAASNAGLVGYMKNVAVRLAPRGVTCNAISLGGVLTPLNDPVVNDPALWQKIMDVTPLGKWMSTDEAAEWIVFLTLTNRSMSGQNILIDNGERDLQDTFVWPGDEQKTLRNS